MAPALAPARATGWLLKHGPRELERLFRAIVHHPSAPILIVDDERHHRDASWGAGRMLGVPREQIIGRTLDEFLDPAVEPKVPELCQTFIDRGELESRLELAAAVGSSREVDYIAKSNVLPVRHLMVFGNQAFGNQAATGDEARIPAWIQDFALLLVDSGGTIAAWYAGAERMFGRPEREAVGQHMSLLYPAADTLGARLSDELNRSAREGHFASEIWAVKATGERFWASVITMALNDENGDLQGYAAVVRDFSSRRERDEQLRRNRAGRPPPAVAQTAVAGIISGEFDQLRDANDAFLEIVGYTREDIAAGRLYWPKLSVPEAVAMDELAHEEALQFGGCTPYRKELVRKDGSRIEVQISTAVLFSPFRWISFVRPLQPARHGSVDHEDRKPVLHFEQIIGSSAGLQRVLGQVEVVAPTNATVLILGETGTGKELIARAVHRLSPRRQLPFVTLNCAAIPTGLLESELFGYERGAFTGALSQKIGRFEMAHKGTLFLDEVGDIPLELQPKLLRALQEKSFERLGGTKTIPIDVRLVAATNRNLTQMMVDKLFRSDLYYRLKVFPVTLPPLRDRPDDIPQLVRFFTKKYATELNKHIGQIPAETMEALVQWPWPGNIRELENFIERSVILSRGPGLRVPLEEIRPDKTLPAYDGSLEQVEREHVIRVLRETGGVISKAALRLAMPRTTLNALMRKLGVERKDL